MLKVTRDGSRFTLEGDVNPQSRDGDHFQLIYEALEIAAHSGDKFAEEFATMRDELLTQSEDWDQE